jgi:hypothetical protein
MKQHKISKIMTAEQLKQHIKDQDAIKKCYGKTAGEIITFESEKKYTADDMVQFASYCSGGKESYGLRKLQEFEKIRRSKMV